MGRITTKQPADTMNVPASMTSDHDTPIVDAMTPPTKGPRSPPAKVPENQFSELLDVR